VRAHGSSDPSTKVHVSAALVEGWGRESFFSSPQRPSRGFEWGDLKIRVKEECRGKVALREGIGNAVINAWDMEDTEINVVGEENVNSTVKEVIVGGEAGEGVEDVHGVQVVRVN
jgi:hypothetical protein